MSLDLFKFRVPIGVQVGAVAALFVAALVVLWATGAMVVARERRRSDARELLEEAGKELDERGRRIIAGVVPFPDFPDEQARVELDHNLFYETSAVLSRHEGLEGGYWARRFLSLLGTVLLKPHPAKAPAEGAEQPYRPPALGRGKAKLPELEADLIDIQVDAAIRKKQVLFSVEELADERPVTVAIRTAPVQVDCRVVGATWVMTRLVNPSSSTDRSRVTG